VLSRVIWLQTSAEVSSGATMCLMALDLVSRQRWTPALSRVLWLWTSPLDRGELRRYQVSYGSGPHLPVEVSSGTVTYPVIPCEPRPSSIKKRLAVLSVQLGTHVSNAHV
jgi:hypothetical protein